MDEFTSCLLDPLKSRDAFGDSLDYLLDAGVELEQKKVLCNFLFLVVNVICRSLLFR